MQLSLRGRQSARRLGSGNRSRAGDWLNFPANLREVCRPVGWLSNVFPGKMCLPFSLPVNGYHRLTVWESPAS